MPTITFNDYSSVTKTTNSLTIIRPEVAKAYFAEAKIEEVEVENTSGVQENEIYTVISGDTLSKIANKKGTTVSAIIESDASLTDDNKGNLIVGQKITLPSLIAIKEKKKKITFEKINRGSIGSEIYVIVETKGLTNYMMSISVRQGMEKCIEDKDAQIMLKDDQEKYHTWLKTRVGGMCDTDYINKDDFVEKAIFKFSIDTYDEEKKKLWIKSIEDTECENTLLYIIADATYIDNQKKLNIQYLGDTEDGEIRGEKIKNRWLDVDGEWFELTKLDDNVINVVRKWEKWTGVNSSSATFSTFNFGGINGFICEPYGEETLKSGKDKRIPAGEYNLKWHVTTKYPKNKYSLETEFGKKWKLDFPVLNNGVVCIFNNRVSTARGILLHAGQDGGWTVGCMLPSSKLNKDLNKKNFKIRDSVETLHKILNKIEVQGIKNIKLIIRDEIT